MRSDLNPTGLAEVNLKFNLNELQFTQPYVASGSYQTAGGRGAAQARGVMAGHSGTGLLRAPDNPPSSPPLLPK